MVRYSYFIILFALLCSCAQIGSITGGPKDNKAPAIVTSTPVDGQTNVNLNQIIIEFDEFIKLDNPKENIVLLPSNVAFDFVLKGKTLMIYSDQETPYSKNLRLILLSFRRTLCH